MAAEPSTVVQTGWNEPPWQRAASAAGTARRRWSGRRANQTYGYDPAYGWLRGRLEYSASQQQWKLRYIPIDGATDQFGGSVVLADGAATQGLRAGDFVTAQGRVVGPSQPGRGFSPRYEVASIEPAAGSTDGASDRSAMRPPIDRATCAIRPARPLGTARQSRRLRPNGQPLTPGAAALPLALFRANVL